MKKILGILKIRTGVDFSSYKASTIRRRIERRMLSNRIESLDAYVAFLNGHHAEAENLYNDILIKVTKFFRDPETFEVLKKLVFDRILVGKSSEVPIRVWVPGCSTGEEVYSLAICLLEYLGDRASNLPIQIFGTDISDEALEKARHASYLDNIEQDVSPERLRRFFAKVNGRYVLSKPVRSVCIFAKQNLLKDPPFSRLDLISCRNVLIYLSGELQKRVMPIFHFALNSTGMLLLGPSETVGTALEIFTCVDTGHKLFSKKPTPSKLLLDFPGGATTREEKEAFHHVGSKADVAQPNLQKEAQRALISHYAPAGVIINAHLDVLQFIGDTGPYLQNSPGEANLNLLRMARAGLHSGLREILKDLKKRPAFTKQGLRVDSNAKTRTIDVEIVPVPLPLSTERFWAVMFKEVDVPTTPAVAPISPKTKGSRGRHQEERRIQEANATKAYLESLISEKDAAFEELQSANEEILSNNEELQSINEEMQTGKEELQSTNEELTTVNDELHHTNLLSAQLVNDLNNVLDIVNIPIVIVDSELHIRRFTSRAKTILHLIPADIGRPLSDVNVHLN